MGTFNLREFQKLCLAWGGGNPKLYLVRENSDRPSPRSNPNKPNFSVAPSPSQHGIHPQRNLSYRPILGYVRTQKRSLIVTNNNFSLDEHYSMAHLLSVPFVVGGRSFTFSEQLVDSHTYLWYEGNTYQMELTETKKDAGKVICWVYKMKPRQNFPRK